MSRPGKGDNMIEVGQVDTVGQMVTIDGEVYEVTRIEQEGDRVIVTLVPFLLWEPTITITLEDNR